MKYYVDDHMGPEDAYDVPKECPYHTLKYVAKYAAEDYHSNHDGWEDSWPLVFVILNDNNEELGQFNIDREAVPQFYATEI